MKEWLISLLACPICRGSVELKESRIAGDTSGNVIEGVLMCLGCQCLYPVVDGVPDLRPWSSLSQHGLPPHISSRYTASTLMADVYTEFWRQYGDVGFSFGRTGSEDLSLLLSRTACAPESIHGRSVLDIGCGSGALCEAMLECGCEYVVGMDVSESVMRANASLRNADRLSFVLGDLLSPPFQPKTFDLMVMRHVLHHIVTPLDALRCICSIGSERHELMLTTYAERPPLWVKGMRSICRLLPMSMVLWLSRRGASLAAMVYNHLVDTEDIGRVRRLSTRAAEEVLVDLLVTPSIIPPNQDQLCRWLQQLGYNEIVRRSDRNLYVRARTSRARPWSELTR